MKLYYHRKTENKIQPAGDETAHAADSSRVPGFVDSASVIMVKLLINIFSLHKIWSKKILAGKNPTRIIFLFFFKVRPRITRHLVFIFYLLSVRHALFKGKLLQKSFCFFRRGAGGVPSLKYG